MAYQVVSVSSPTAIIDAIHAFALALGFTIEYHDTNGSSERVLSISGGSLDDYAHFYMGTAGTDLYTLLSQDFSAGATIGQTTRSQPARSNLLTTGPYLNVFLFGEYGTSSDYIHGVIEISSGYFRHFGVGHLNKIGTWTGGDYNYGTYWDQSPDHIDGPTNQYHCTPFDFYGTITTEGNAGCIRCDDCDATGTHPSGVDTSYCVVAHSYARAVNAGYRAINTVTDDPGGGFARCVGGAYDVDAVYFNNRVEPAPITCFVTRDAGYSTIIGNVPAARFCSIGYLSPKDEITIGSDIWKVFPMVRLGTTADNTERSGKFAMAYKKVT